MSNKVKTIIKNFSYTIIANFVSFLISVLLILVVPKIIGIQEYGYWQLYLFYSLYVGFLHFGWADGIYLRYGGSEYKELNKKTFFSQFYSLAFFQILIGILFVSFTLQFTSNVDRMFILYMLAGYLVLINLRYMLLYILQATNRMKESAKITIIDRILYFIIIVVFLILGEHNYKLLIVVDLFCKLVSLIYAMYCCKEIVFQKYTSFSFDFNETIENIKAGIKLMFATIASMLILGTVRFGIEQKWSVETFGKVSLALSISNLFMTFINAISVTLFPLLKRTNENNLNNIYEALRTLLMVVLFGVLIVYYPLSTLLFSWLPQYHDTFVYMIFIFPLCIYEGKVSLLINNYLKVIRREKVLMYMNIMIMLLSVCTTFITVAVLENLNFAVLSIIILLSLRCMVLELQLSRILKIKVGKDIFLEFIMTFIFISSAWFFTSFSSFIIYVISFFLYIVLRKKDISKSIQSIRQLV